MQVVVARPFLRFAAVCSLLGAVTTALLLFLPSPPSGDFAAQVRLAQDPLYLSRLWILFFHPQVNFIASLGVAYLLWRQYPLQVTVGTLFLACWAYTEMAQQALLIDSLNQIWRPGYAQAEDPVVQERFRTLIEAAGGISDSQYFLVIYGFGLGSLLFGWAFVLAKDWSRWIGVSLIFIGLLSLSSFARYYWGVAALNGIVNWCYAWVYPYLQPAVRIALGIWIWRNLTTLPAESALR